MPGFDPEQVYELVDADGGTAYRTGADVEKALGQGMRLKTATDTVSEQQAASEESFFTSPTNQAKAFARGVTSGATFGVSSMAERLGSTEDERTEQRLLREHNKGLDLAGNLIGAAGTAFIPGAPAAFAAKAGSAVTRGLGEGVLATGAGLATEGAIQGFGQGVQELAVSADPIDVERAVSAIGSNVLFGAAGGGGVGIAGKAAGKALPRLGQVVREAAAAGGVRQTGTEIAKDVETYFDDIGDTFLGLDEGRGAARKAKASARGLTDDIQDLAENPRKAGKALRIEHKVIKEAVENAPAARERFVKEAVELAAGVGKKIDEAADSGIIKLKDTEARRYADWAGIKVSGKEGVDVAVDEALRFKAAIDSGEVRGMREAALDRLPARLARNEELQKAIAAHGQESWVSKTLTKAGQGMALGAVTGFVPGGAIGAAIGMVAPDVIRKVTDTIARRLSAAGAESAARTASSLDTLFSAAKPAGRAAVPLSTKVLSELRFAPEAKTARGAAVVTKAPTLLSAFKERERELRTQVSVGPDGRPAMKPAARERIAEGVQAMAAADPVLADRIETVAARRAEFLASKLPKRPDYMATQFGPDRWQPSDMQMRAFARYVSAVEDPGAVEERLASGVVTPEDAEAYRSVYPERFAALRMQIVERLPQLRQSLPYERQIALSIFTGVPIDPAMQPQVIARLQGTYGGEAGSEGGAMAPRAMPQSGSVKGLEEPTRAQERAS